MPGRLLVIPDARTLDLRALLEARSRELATSLVEDGFDDVFDETLRAVLTNDLKQTGADEGTIWLLDAAREFLIPQFNSGPRAADFVGKFRQSLRSGMISMVVATEMPICENDVPESGQQDRALDRQLGLTTCAMIAVPFYFAGELRGVISAVRLRGETKRSGFGPESLLTLQRSAMVLSRLAEHRLLTLCLGSAA